MPSFGPPRRARARMARAQAQPAEDASDSLPIVEEPGAAQPAGAQYVEAPRQDRVSVNPMFTPQTGGPPEHDTALLSTLSSAPRSGGFPAVSPEEHSGEAGTDHRPEAPERDLSPLPMPTGGPGERPGQMSFFVNPDFVMEESPPPPASGAATTRSSAPDPRARSPSPASSTAAAAAPPPPEEEPQRWRALNQAISVDADTVAAAQAVARRSAAIANARGRGEEGDQRRRSASADRAAAAAAEGGSQDVESRHYFTAARPRDASPHAVSPHARSQAGSAVSGETSRVRAEAAAELSALIMRAQHLMGKMDTSQTVAFSSVFGGSGAVGSPLTPASQRGGDALAQPRKSGGAGGGAGGLASVEEGVDEEELLNRKLHETRGSLAAAYKALNDNYERATTAPPPGKAGSHSGSFMDSGDLQKSSLGSEEKARLKAKIRAEREAAAMGRGVGGGADGTMQFGEMLDPKQQVAAYHVQRSRLLTSEEYKEARRKETTARRGVKISLVPMALYVLFIAAAVFYVYTRVRFGMGGLQASLRSYSYFVLFVEILGMINMLFYGCWLFAKPVNSDVFPEPDEFGVIPPLRRRYNVRVLIPCYKESLAIVQRTVLAARRADRPAGTRVIIYICDDGADPAKSQWVSSLLDRDVIYITGRDKSEKSKNGKSANLNNTLQLIYPDVRDPHNQDELCKIPVNELMCLFDADQTCSRGFFDVMLRYIDSGDDIGVALSPQLMYNVVPDCDIFNHQNVHFWEMMQPGMDALNFISLTGTNMILRSRALHEAGWFPMNSVTEDWALGMRFKKLGYRCRYVDRYLCIGEAPDISSQAFQQRSRWSKGHFQTFYSNECPLWDERLNIFFRLAYSSTCIGYLSTGLSVPVLTLVPVLTILFGWFPIALNLLTVVGITVYYGSLNFLSFYCHSWSHYKALWLANCSSVLLFYPYLKASFFSPIKQVLGQTMEFKTTLKGGNSSNFSLRTFGPAIVIVLLNVVTFIVGLVRFDVNINAAKSISLCWIVFNTVPHAMLLLHAYWGPGLVLVGFCKVFMFLTNASGVLAIVLMWLLYPREVEFVEPLAASIRLMQTQWSGKLPADYPVAWRADTGTQYANFNFRSSGIKRSPNVFEHPNMPSFNATLDVSGGFYEDGPWGPVKLTKSIALSTSLLAWTLLDAEGTMREDENVMNQALVVVQHGLEYVKACHIRDPRTFKLPIGDVYVYQVGDPLIERQLWRRPEDVTSREQTFVTAAIEEPTDLTGQMTAAVVAATMALHNYGWITNADLLDNFKLAKRLYNVTLETKGVVKHYRSLWTSDSFYDDRLWAASWMHRAAKEQKGDLALQEPKFFTDMQDAYYNAIGEEDTFIVDQDYVLNIGLVHAAINTFSYEFHEPAQTFVWDWICSGHADSTALGRALAPDSPYLGDTVMAAGLAQMYAVKMQYWDGLKKGFREGFQCFAEQQARYVIGFDWARRSYMVGVGARGYDHTVHHGASCPAWPEPCPPDMAGSPAPDANVIEGGLLWLPKLTDRPKNTRGANYTAVSLGNNYGVPLLMAMLGEKSGTWLQCLQNSGEFLPHGVCRHDRPVPVEKKGREKRQKFWGYQFANKETSVAREASLEKPLPLTRDNGTPLPKFKLDPKLWEYDLESLLGNALRFYEAQRSGKLPPHNRLPWRGDTYLDDGSEHTPPKDFSGGWFDAGDTLKLTFPFCASVWRLAWVMIAHKDILKEAQFEEAPVYEEGIRQLRWAAEYLLKIHFKKGTRFDSLVIQIGERSLDHTIKVGRPFSPEHLSQPAAADTWNVTRPVWVLSSQTGGSDLLSEAVSAFAALSTLFADVDPRLSVLLSTHANDAWGQLQGWNRHRRYSDIHPPQFDLYKSEEPKAHMFTAAAWMFKMTGDKAFQQSAQAYHAQAADAFFNPAIGWNNPVQEGRLIMEELGSQQDISEVQRWLEAAFFGNKGMPYSPEGLMVAVPWGSLRIAALHASVAFKAAHILDARADDSGEVVNIGWAHYARCYGKQQLDYIMGSSGRSFVTGWGENPPKRPHHRTAMCGFVENGELCDATMWANPNATFANELPGGLVAGPDNVLDEWVDDHRNFQTSEVANDFNAALVSGVANMMALPPYFWRTLQHCPTFPVAKIDFGEAKFQPIEGVKLTRDHPAVVPP